MCDLSAHSSGKYRRTPQKDFGASLINAASRPAQLGTSTDAVQPAQGQITPGPGSRPSLSPLLTRQLAFNSGAARIERRPSLLGAQPASQPMGQQEGAQQVLTSPSASQGFRKRHRFLISGGSQPDAEPPALQPPVIPGSAPAMGHQSAAGADARRAAATYSSRLLPPAAPILAATANTGAQTVASAPGSASRKHVSTAMHSTHLQRNTVDTSVPNQQFLALSSSRPVQAPPRPVSVTEHHEQSLRDAVPLPAVVSLAPNQPPQKPAPPDCSLPGFAAGRELQPAKPAAKQGSAIAKQPGQTGAALAQNSTAVQHGHHQHISLKETYREVKDIAPAHPAVIAQAGVPGERHSYQPDSDISVSE